MQKRTISLWPFIVLSLAVHLVILAYLLNITPYAPKRDTVKNVNFNLEKAPPKVASYPPTAQPQTKPVKPAPLPEPIEGSGKAPLPPPTPFAARQTLEIPIEPPNVTVPPQTATGSMQPNALLPSHQALTRYIERFESQNPEKVAEVTMSFGGEGGIQYLSYLMRIKRKIEAVFDYPPLARESALRGVTNILFVIEKDGRLGHVALLNSSNYKILDDGAMHALLKAAPFEPIPTEFDKDKFRINGFFIFY